MNDREYKCLQLSNYSVMPDTISYTEGIKFGIKWADENPKEGLVSIEKACEYLESKLKSRIGYYSAYNFANDFRKAMEN